MALPPVITGTAAVAAAASAIRVHAAVPVPVLLESTTVAAPTPLHPRSAPPLFMSTNAISAVVGTAPLPPHPAVSIIVLLKPTPEVAAAPFPPYAVESFILPLVSAETAFTLQGMHPSSASNFLQCRLWLCSPRGRVCICRLPRSRSPPPTTAPS